MAAMDAVEVAYRKSDPAVGHVGKSAKNMHAENAGEESEGLEKALILACGRGFGPASSRPPAALTRQRPTRASRQAAGNTGQGGRAAPVARASPARSLRAGLGSARVRDRERPL